MKNYKLLSGNEALAQGAYEAGVKPKFATLLNKKRHQKVIFPTVKNFFDV